MTLSKSKLLQKAAGYMLAAANAGKKTDLTNNYKLEQKAAGYILAAANAIRRNELKNRIL